MVTNIRGHEGGILVRCNLRLELRPLICFIDFVIKEDTQGFDDYPGAGQIGNHPIIMGHAFV